MADTSSTAPDAANGARVGLVLGAGGVVGQAYHAGVLAALEEAYDWDARRAEVIVGTSAGSIVGTLLRADIPAGRLAYWADKAPIDVSDAAPAAVLPAELPELERFRPGRLVSALPRVPHPTMVLRAVRRPWQFRPLAAFLSLAAPGSFDISEHLEALRALEAGGWPERELWICAVRRRDGRLVVFGTDERRDVPLHLAVAASCAVPGYFAPVQIGPRAYVDGGAHSPTNADLLRTRPELDLVVVVAPMSGAGLPTGLNGLLRRHSRHRLRREVAALRAVGLDVVTFEPGPAEQAAMGDDLLSRDPVDEDVEAAHRGALELATRPGIDRALDRLRSDPLGDPSPPAR